MNQKKNITVAFTGHRSYNGSADERLAVLLEELYGRGYRRFLTGMAWGFDLAAAEAVMRLKQSHDDVELIAIEPFAWFSSLFRGVDAERYARVKAAASGCITAGHKGDRMDFIHRNDMLVEGSSVMVAWWSGTRHGGTAYTIGQARHAGEEIHNLYDQQYSLFEF